MSGPADPADAPSAPRLRPAWSRVLIGACVVVAVVVGVCLLAAGGWVTVPYGLALTLLIVGAVAAIVAATALRTARRPTQMRSVIVSVFVWAIVLLGLSWLWLEGADRWDLFGTTERLLLVPIVMFTLFGLATVLRLRRWVSYLAIIVFVLAMLGAESNTPADWPQELVAAAGPTDLAAAQRAGDPISLRAARHDAGAPVAWVPYRHGMRCQRAQLRDQRRTLVGSQARRVVIKADACWSSDGKPYVVRLIADSSAGETQSNPRAVTVEPAPFTESPIRGGNADSDLSSAFGGQAAPSDPQRDRGWSYNFHPWDQQARVRFTEDDHTVRVAVDPSGRRIRLTTGWFLADPFSGSTDEFQESYVVGTALGPGRLADVLTVDFERDGDPHAQLVRYRGERGDVLARSR